jgi:hypothetical protein
MTNTITVTDAPQTTPVLIDTVWYNRRGKAYAFPTADGYLCYSADDGTFLTWSANLSDAPLDASLAELDRERSR